MMSESRQRKLRKLYKDKPEVFDKLVMKGKHKSTPQLSGMRLVKKMWKNGQIVVTETN